MIPLEPIELKVPGTLGMDIVITPHETGAVDFKGTIAFALSRSIHSALHFLPFGMAKKITDGLIHRDLKDNQFTLKVGAFSTVHTTISSEGIFTVKADYHVGLAKTATYKELAVIYDTFAERLEVAGITPSIQPAIDKFLKEFKTHDEGLIDFAHLFNGKHLELDGLPEYPINQFTFTSLTTRLDEAGDLYVAFEAKGLMVLPA